GLGDRGGRLRRLRPGTRLECRRAGEGQSVHAREVSLPLFVDGGGIVPPALVLVFDEHLVDAEIAVEIHRAQENSGSAPSGPWNASRHVWNEVVRAIISC